MLMRPRYAVFVCVLSLALPLGRAGAQEVKEVKDKSGKKEIKKPTGMDRGRQNGVPKPPLPGPLLPGNVPIPPGVMSPPPGVISPPPAQPTPPAPLPTSKRPAPRSSAVEAPPAYAASSVPGEFPGDDAELYRCKRFPSGQRIKLTLKPETELKELVTWVMGFTCKNFIYGAGIAGRSSRVTIIAPSEMTPPEAFRLFLVALQTMNLTVVPKEKVLEIVEAPRARETPLPVYRSGTSVPATDQIVRALIRPQYSTVDDLMMVMNSLKSKDGTITPVGNAGVLIVTDYGLSIDRMMDVLRDLEQPGGSEKIYMIKLHNSDATLIAQKLTEIFQIGRGGPAGVTSRSAPQPAPPRRSPGEQPLGVTPNVSQGPSGGGSVNPSRIMADERTNSLIVIASDAAYARILALVKRLDVAIEGGEGSIHVYYLMNASSEELAGTLNSLVSGQPMRQAAGRGGGAQVPQVPGQAGGGVVFEGTVRITSDKPTNSLVIVSSVKDYISVREVIRKLDMPRRQVFVEARILEVTLSKTRQMGLSFHGGTDTQVGGHDSILFGGVQHGDLSSFSVASAAAQKGLISGILGSEIPNSQEILGVSFPSFGVILDLLQNNNDANVLSSPHLLTTDNEPAEITIGENIPFQGSVNPAAALGGQAGSAAGLLGALGTSVQRQDVGLKLKITPHVNDSDYVRLEIDQESSKVLQLNAGGLGPSWGKRSVKTTVVVRDQQPVVIGGLMDDDVKIVESKVPLLGDIPILGYLFKFQRKEKKKTNLLIFLTPYVIKDQGDIERIFERKTRERKEFLATFTSFQDENFSVEVNYGRKRGLLEEINQSVKRADEDERMLREAEQQTRAIEGDGPVELDPPAGEPKPPVPPPADVPPSEAR